MKELTKEDLKRYKENGYLTVGKLKEILYKMPPDAIVMVERIEDRYFDGNDISGFGGCKDTPDGKFPEGSKSEGWSVYLVEGENHYFAKKYNEDVANGDWEDQQPHPTYTEEQLNDCKDQFVPAWCCGPHYLKPSDNSVRIRKPSTREDIEKNIDPDIFLIHMHY
jgi:hypothetical protein